MRHGQTRSYYDADYARDLRLEDEQLGYPPDGDDLEPPLLSDAELAALESKIAARYLASLPDSMFEKGGA